MKDKVFIVLFLTLAFLVILLSFVYLVSGWMVPGLLPFCQAVLAIPMYKFWKSKEPKWIGILFFIAAVLNVIAGIMQILMQ